MRNKKDYSVPITDIVNVDTESLLDGHSIGDDEVDGPVGAKRHNFYDDNRHEDNPDGTIEVPHLWDE